MHADKYTELAQRTSAPNFFDRKVAYHVLLGLLGEIFMASSELDKIKKAMFYGKTPEKTDAADLNHSFSLYGRDFGFNEAEKRQIHAIIGVITEAGELAEILAERLTGQTERIDVPHVGEEMGDILWYVAESAAHGTPMSEMMAKNIEKLRIRFPNKFDAEDAAHRNLDAEDAVLGKVKISR